MDLFGNVTSQLPPWLTNTPSPSQIVDKAFQSKNQAIRNYTDLAQLNQRQQEMDRVAAMAPLLQRETDLRNQSLAIDISNKQLGMEVNNNTKLGISKLGEIMADTTDWTDPSVPSKALGIVKDYPQMLQSPMGQKALADVLTTHNTALGASAKIQQSDIRAQAAEEVARLKTEAFERQKEADRTLKERMGLDPSGRPIAAKQKLVMIRNAREALSEAQGNGDPAEIAKAEQDLSDTLASAGIKTGEDLTPYLKGLWHTQASKIASDPTLTTEQARVTSERAYQQFLKNHNIGQVNQAVTTQTAKPAASAPQFKSQDDVVNAYKGGKLNRDQAADILNKQFGVSK